jgi:hypothetical protein
MDVLMDDPTVEQTPIEMEIEELVHRDVADLRKQARNDNRPADDIGSLLSEISSTAVHEIDALIGELKIIRERLVIEAERVHREVADYAALNQSAIQATRSIVESLNHSKHIADSPSIAEP